MELFNFEYNSNPNILHRAGCDHPMVCTCCSNCKGWKNISLNFFKKKHFYKYVKDISLITWNNKENKQILEKCFDHLNLKYFCLGKNIENWNNTHKIKTLFDFHKKIETDYVLCLDSFDVLFLGNLEKTIEEFEIFKCDMVISAAPKKTPPESNAEIENLLAPKNAPFIYLNAGCWIAKRNFLNEIIVELNEDVNKNKSIKFEQFFIRKIFNKKYKEIKIDYFMKIFQSGFFHKLLLNKKKFI
jgi:hypothetical protein